MFMERWGLGYFSVSIYVTESTVCSGPWPFKFNLFFFPVVLSLFWLGGSFNTFMALIIWSVKTYMLGPLHPLSHSVPAEAGHLVWAVAWAPMRLIQGRAYTVSWLV